MLTKIHRSEARPAIAGRSSCRTVVTCLSRREFRSPETVPGRVSTCGRSVRTRETLLPARRASSTPVSAGGPRFNPVPQDGNLMAQPFDAKNSRVTGDPFRSPNVSIFRRRSMDCSPLPETERSFIRRSAPGVSQLLWFDRPASRPAPGRSRQPGESAARRTAGRPRHHGSSVGKHRRLDLRLREHPVALHVTALDTTPIWVPTEPGGLQPLRQSHRISTEGCNGCRKR